MRKWEYMVTRINGAIATLPNSSHSKKLAEYGTKDGNWYPCAMKLMPITA